MSYTGSFQDHAGNHVVAGDRVEYRLEGRVVAQGIIRDAFQDGDAYVDFDDSIPRECKWNNLWKVVSTL